MRTRAIFRVWGCLLWTALALSSPAAAQRTIVAPQVRSVPAAPLPFSGPTLGAPPLGSAGFYDALLQRQKTGEILDLTAVTRPGIAIISDGRLGIAQGSGRFEALRPGESMDLFVPQGAVLPAGVVILQDGVPAEVVLKANLLSSRGEAGSNPELVGLLAEGKTFTRVLAPHALLDAPMSKVAHEIETLRSLLTDPARGWDGDTRGRIAEVLAGPEYNSLSLRGRLDVLRRLAEEPPGNPAEDAPRPQPTPAPSAQSIAAEAPGPGGWTGRIHAILSRFSRWISSPGPRRPAPRLTLDTLMTLPERLRELVRQGDLKGLLDAVEKPLPAEAELREIDIASMSAADELLRALKAALSAAYLSGLEPGHAAPTALAAHLRTEKQSGPTCAFHALFNALKIAGRMGAGTTPEQFAAYGRVLLEDESKGRDRGLTHKDIGTLAGKLGLGIQARAPPAGAAELRRLLGRNQPVLGVLRFFKPGRGLHGYDDVEHAVLVHSAFYSKTRREWVFAVLDSGPGRTTYYDWPTLRALLQKVYLLEIPADMIAPHSRSPILG